MAPVHFYLAAWVLGGVLLGASMLLDARQPELPEPTLGSDDPEQSPRTFGSAREPVLLAATPVRKAQRGWARSLRVVPLGLIGFGLSGLLAKGLDLDLGPWTSVTASGVGMGLIALGYRLSRARLPASSSHR